MADSDISPLSRVPPTIHKRKTHMDRVDEKPATTPDEPDEGDQHESSADEEQAPAETEQQTHIIDDYV